MSSSFLAIIRNLFLITLQWHLRLAHCLMVFLITFQWHLRPLNASSLSNCTLSLASACRFCKPSTSALPSISSFFIHLCLLLDGSALCFGAEAGIFLFGAGLETAQGITPDDVRAARVMMSYQM